MAPSLLVIFLTACLLMVTGFAKEEVGPIHVIYDDSFVKLPAEYKVHEMHTFFNSDLHPRHEITTLTVTETVCEPGYSGSPPFITVPVASGVTGTLVNSPSSTTEKLSAPSDTQSTPSTSSTTSRVTSGTSETSAGPTTKPHSTTQTSVDATEAPTGVHTSTPSPPSNAALVQKEMGPAFLALVVTCVGFLMG